VPASLVEAKLLSTAMEDNNSTRLCDGTPLGKAVGHSWAAPGISSGLVGDPGAWRSLESLEA